MEITNKPANLLIRQIIDKQLHKVQDGDAYLNDAMDRAISEIYLLFKPYLENPTILRKSIFTLGQTQPPYNFMLAILRRNLQLFMEGAFLIDEMEWVEFLDCTSREYQKLYKSFLTISKQ